MLVYRLEVEDGSGCGCVYTDGDVVRECLRATSSEWKELCDLVAMVGEVTYTKALYHKVSVKY